LSENKKKNKAKKTRKKIETNAMENAARTHTIQLSSSSICWCSWDDDADRCDHNDEYKKKKCEETKCRRAL